MDPEAVRRALDAALPVGLDVLEVVEVGLGGGASLSDLLQASFLQQDKKLLPRIH